jgi:acyl-CoA thioester hydrolase
MPMAAQDVARTGVVAPLAYKLRVRYAECDPQGVVFNAHYFAYFDVALTEAWRELFGAYGAMYEHGIDMVVAEARARFLGGARFDDELELRWWVTRLGTTAMSTRIDVAREDTTLVEGQMRHVFVEAGTTDKKPIPPEIRARLEQCLVEPGPSADALRCS